MCCLELGVVHFVKPTTSPTNVATLVDKMEKFGGGSKLLRWRNTLVCLVRIVGKYEVAFDEPDITQYLDDVEAL